jgi:hypothetical protein
MSGIWRVVVVLLLIGVPALLAPALGVDAANDLAAHETTARDSEREKAKETCKSSNPRKQKKCHYNGWDNGNWRDLPDGEDNDNEDEVLASTANPTMSTASTAGGLTVELWRSSEAPAPHAPLNLTVTGSGGSVTMVSWRSTGPTADDPVGGDMAHLGELTFDCAGVVPCSNTWTVTPRYPGYYAVYAKVRDVTGTEAEVVWKFTAG